MQGVENIKSALKNITSSSGVYRMIDPNNRILYIGKAKDLKKRVYSYTLIKKLTNRLRRMVAQVENMRLKDVPRLALRREMKWNIKAKLL